MNKLDTLHPTEVYSDYLVDPSIMNSIFKDTKEKRKVVFYDYTYKNYHTNFIKDISSGFLTISDGLPSGFPEGFLVISHGFPIGSQWFSQKTPYIIHIM